MRSATHLVTSAELVDDRLDSVQRVALVSDLLPQIRVHHETVRMR